MKEIHWLCAMGVAMLVGALLIFAGWMLGRQGINKRIIVTAPTISVAPAQVNVAPAQIQVEPSTVNIAVPAPVVNVTTPETKTIIVPQTPQPKAEVKAEIKAVIPAPVAVVVPAPVKRDINEYGELLPPPKK